MTKSFPSRRPRRSLRTILMVWFLLLSLLPVMFVTGYSLIKYEQAVNNELLQRLRGNAREIATIVSEYEKLLVERRERHRANPALPYYLLTNSAAQANEYTRAASRNSIISTRLMLFNRDGELISSNFLNDPSGSERAEEQRESTTYLSDDYRLALEQNRDLSIVDVSKTKNVELVAFARIDSKNGRIAGFVEEVINIGQPFIDNLKRRLGLELILFDSKGNIVSSTHPDFLLYPSDHFAASIASDPDKIFDLTVRGEPLGFITSPVQFGEAKFFIGLGASKQQVRALLRNINYAFFTMLGAIGVLLVLTSIVATRVIVRPVNELVQALQVTDVRDTPISIPVTTDTELGVLTESFNEMSRRISQAKSELQNKIKELEAAYGELKDTQTRLVHSAKMASLGQVVAGVAHELNNPIGFIYSNMTHLRDYSERLTRLIEVAEREPERLAQAKIEADFDYIVKDLPRLIGSCEDGARRTRDIVLGLRSFSRLEEAKIKRVSLQDGLEETLRLLIGETKNRIRVHTEFNLVPEVLCYASQINQVFMNILTNAAQAIEGEGDIWITLRQQTSDDQRPRAQVSIRDSGKGMSPETVEKIFDPFFTTKSVGQGTGLGLSISYGIVKKHGGEIQVKSEPGQGTEFLISIPIDGPLGIEA